MADSAQAAAPPAEGASPEAEVLQIHAELGAKPNETQDEALDRILGPITDGSGPAPAEEEPEAEPSTEESTTDASADVVSEADGAEGTSPDGETPSPELESALKSLRQAGFATEDLEGMSDERVLMIGAKQAKIQKDSQEHVRKLQADLKAAQESTPEIKADSAGEFAELASEETAAKIREGMKPLAEDFGWEDKHADALTKLVSDAALAATKPLHAALEETKVKLERANTAAFQALFDNARRELGERIPRLRDDAVFKDKVEPQLAKLDIARYDSVKDILLDAVRIAGLRIYKSKEEAESTADELSRAKANGKPTADSRGGDAGDPKDLSPEERTEKVLDAVFGHKDLKEAKRLYGS